MALTSSDETDLILPLFDAAGESPPFRTFLERLQRRTKAHHLNIVIRAGQEISEFYVGPDMRRRANEHAEQEFALLDKINYDRLRPGRVYSAEEFLQADPAQTARRAEYMRSLGIADERVVRVLADVNVSAWLIMSRTSPCTAQDSALLSALAPYVGRTLRTMLALDRERLAGDLSLDGLGRAGSSWIALDGEARVVDATEAAAEALGAAGISLRIGARIGAIAPRIEQELAAAAAEFSARSDAPSRTVVLSAEPRIEALLTPAGDGRTTVLSAPAMIAYLRWARSPSPDRAAQFAVLFGLAGREAELAVALADGYSLSEAAEELGLTIETTRNYSKRLYAKLGVRGQAEVVRLVGESVAALA
jgi:DNA-binding CsgD family transcriptional regulator